MIQVEIKLSDESLIKEMSVTGHSGFAEHGNDIICASASTLIYTAIASLEEICGLKDFYQITESSCCSKTPEAILSIPEKELAKGADQPSQWILASIRKGFFLLEDADKNGYGGNHIRVKERQG